MSIDKQLPIKGVKFLLKIINSSPLLANLTIYQKGAYYSGIKIFNDFPLEIKNVAGNHKKF
jgi:hypothetical protein